MHNLDFKVGFGRKKDPRYMRHHTWVAVAVGGSALLGAGTAVYGANKQSKDNRAAQEQNALLQEKQNNSAWQGYLMSRGLDPMGATAGNVPTGGRALNSKLPLWANVNIARGGATPRITGMSAPRSSPTSGFEWWRSAATPSAGAPAVDRSWNNLRAAV